MREMIDEPLGRHWKRRILAVIIDYSIVYLLTFMIFGMMEWPVKDGWIPTWDFQFVGGFIALAYFILLEYPLHCTIGKYLASLRVYSLIGYQGELELPQVILRNISKFHPILAIIDAIIGMIGSSSGGDGRQKLSDIVARTIVATVGEMVFEVEEVKPVYIPPPKIEEPKKEKETIRVKAGTILTRQCPNCGTPYQVVVKPDGRVELLGPWQFRCTWCNAYLGNELRDLEELVEVIKGE